MREPDSLDALLREWKSPEPPGELDRRVTSAYRSAVRRRDFPCEFGGSSGRCG